MPSTKPLPTIAELVQAFHAGVRGQEDPAEDKISGSGYDIIAGLGALMWRRQAENTRDIFEAIYADTASGRDLTDYFEPRTGIDRYLDAVGTGSAVFVRPSASFGADTIWQGTTIRVATSLTESRTYITTSDTTVAATTTAVVVPIEATDVGPQSAIDAAGSSSATLTIDDPLADSTWTVRSILCDPGTFFESAADYKSRVAQAQRDARIGYVAAIVKAVRQLGAVNVAAYASDYPGSAIDQGINVVYVGDASFTSTTALIRQCTLALESVRVAGADLQVLPMATARVDFTLTLTLWSDPGIVDQQSVRVLTVGALTGYFSGSSRGYGYRLDKIAGSILRACGGLVTAVDFNGASDAALLTGGHFPTTLTKYSLGNVSITMQGPS